MPPTLIGPSALLGAAPSLFPEPLDQRHRCRRRPHLPFVNDAGNTVEKALFYWIFSMSWCRYGADCAVSHLCRVALELRMVMTIIARERLHGHAEMPGGFPRIDSLLHQPCRAAVSHDVRRDLAVAIIKPGKL
jgi:hypothetical protein